MSMERRHDSPFDGQVVTWEEARDDKGPDEIIDWPPVGQSWCTTWDRLLSACPLIFLTCCSDGIQWPWCELLCGETHMTGTRGGLHLKAIKVLGSTTCENQILPTATGASLEVEPAHANLDQLQPWLQPGSGSPWAGGSRQAVPRSLTHRNSDKMNVVMGNSFHSKR